MIQLSILKFLKNNKVSNVYIKDEKNTSLDKTTTLYVYTDGSCKNNGKHNAIAGIGIYFGENDNRNLYKTFTGKQSNNTAELSSFTAGISSGTAEFSRIIAEKNKIIENKKVL